MKAFIVLVAIFSMANLVRSDCPVSPPCKNTEKMCFLGGPPSPDGCLPAPLCIPADSKLDFGQLEKCASLYI